MSGENQVEDCCVVEDGGEIMVEIVGSDVFLDGFGTTNEKGDSMTADVAGSDSQIVVNGEENCTLVVSQEVAVSVDETVDNNSANANRESTEIPNDCVVGEIGGAEVDTDVSMIKDYGVDDNVNTDQLNDPVEALAEGENDVVELVTEEKSEGADNNSDTFLFKDVNEDKPRKTGEGIDTKRIEEVLECQGTATIQELDAPTENVRLSPNDTKNQVAEDNPVVDAEIGVDNFVEENRTPQNKELEVSLQKSVAEHGDVDMSENVKVSTSNDETNKSRESEEDSSKSHDNRSSETRLVDVGKETEQHQEYHQEQEVDVETEQLSDAVVSSLKRKDFDPLTDGLDKRANINAANISASTDQTPKPSFKIGECILRVANQLTGGTSMVVNEISAESSSLIDILSQFQIVAQDPSNPHKFRDEILTFFSGFRSSVVATKRVRKKKSDKSVGGPAEEFEFDDAKDSYWTDMIVQNSPEKQTLHDNEKGEGRLQLAVPVNGEKPEKSCRKPQSRKKRYFTGHIPNTSDEFEEKAKRMKQENSPAELILNFSVSKCVPSEINLNKVFRRFGPLLESETEVDYESGRARVIFKRGSDAEVANSSSQIFSIFGSVLVNYQIGYSPLISVKVLPP